MFLALSSLSIPGHVIKPVPVVSGPHPHRHVVQHQHLVRVHLDPPRQLLHALLVLVGAFCTGQRCRQGGVDAAAVPPPAAVISRAVAAPPVVVVVVVGAEGTATVFQVDRVGGHVAREPLQHQAKLFALALNPVGTRKRKG